MAELISPPGLLCFPNLFTPKAMEAGQTPKFDCVLVFDKAQQATPEFKALKEAALKSAQEKWPSKLPSGLRNPFRDGAEKDYQGFGEGTVYVRFSSTEKPGIVDAFNNEIVAPEDVWAGQIARVACNTFAFDTAGNKGVAFGLRHVQVLKRNMPRLDGRKSAGATFGGQAVPAGYADDASAGGADLPF